MEDADDVSSVVEGTERDEAASDAQTVSDDVGDDVDDDAEVELNLGSRVGNLTRAQLAALTPEEQLAKWQGVLLPIESDLVTELDASNLFFVHAEALIYDIIDSKEVDFENDTQFLRLTFTVEQLLSRVKAAGGNFRLVFFDCCKCLFSAAFSDSAWAFRQAFLLHCKANDIDYAVFPHWYCPEWKDHVTQWKPSFFLGCNTSVELEHETEDEGDGTASKVKVMFHSFMMRCLAAKTHFAMLRGLQCRGSRINAFTLEPDVYDSFVDKGAEAGLSQFLEGHAQSGDGASQDSIAAELEKFAAGLGEHVAPSAVIRSFVTARFARSTLALGGSGKDAALMKVVVKALMLHEMMLRQIPVGRRCITVVPAEQWTLYRDMIASSALARYYTAIAGDLTSLAAKTPEGVQVNTSDFFDGRLYRHIFHFIIDHGLGKGKGQVKSDHFSLQQYVMEELEFLWSEAGAKEPFFPIAVAPLKEFEGIEPPEVEADVWSREEPQLTDIQSDFITTLKKGMPRKLLSQVREDDENSLEIKHVEIVPPPDDQDMEMDEEHRHMETIWRKHAWRVPGFLDAVKMEETMEKGGAEKKMEEKMKAKGKITDRDLAFQHKFVMKRRQMALRALHQYSKSLSGSDKLHPPIIMRDQATTKKGDADSKDKNDSKDVKLSKKHLEILEKRKLEDEQKTQEHDKAQLKSWEPKVEAFGDHGDMGKLEKDVLDTLLGFNRVTDSFVNFPSVSSAFDTPEARCKIVLLAIKSIRKSMKKLQLDKVAPDCREQARRLVCYLFCMCQEAFNSFAKSVLDGKGVKALQEALISIGFGRTAARMFAEWKDHHERVAQLAAEAAAAAEKEKGGKDDKKKGKDDKKKEDAKKDAKKDDKKDKKDDKKDKKDKKGKKDDSGDEGGDDIGKFFVKKDVESLWSGVGDDEFAFQLQHLGPYMTRAVGNAKDPKARVNFRPDGWQRNLLDIVDEEKSALIVAPTASGKTFICYYVMDQVLRADNDSVAVYVAPSKALVNQVSAEIYARFSSKTYPAHCKNELLGVFLREYNSAAGYMEAGKWKNCQILVTIPYVLEMLLLSPTHQDWVKRLKWVVFDEVHCIGGEDGLQWEHTMQLIPCPFLALSATVAEPQHFHSWLGKVNQKKETSPVEIVIHSERFNDLYKYIYRDNELQPLHPFSCLMEQSVKVTGLSSDLSMTPREMNELFICVRAVIGKDARWEQLAPITYFAQNSCFLTKLDARRFEKVLKAIFLELVREGTLAGDKFERLKLLLQAPESAQVSFQPSASAIADAEQVNDITKMTKGTGYLQPAILWKLCKDLETRQVLPAIFFNFSRKEIDRMLNKLIQELKDQQKEKYYGTEEAQYKSRKIMAERQAVYQRKKTAYEEALKAKESKNQEAKSARKNAEEGDRGAMNDDAAQVSEDVGEEPQPPVDLADEIDQDFSFHGQKAYGQWHTEIEEELKELGRKGVDQHLLDGLRRGIGLHHEGAKTSYRQAVEVLFRRGYLKVVFATGTLALGINMPCRTTIFCGDSLELNGLMYRQMAGRAGRRGFDLLGQVVFLDMAFLKVRALVTSDLSTLTGEFVQSPSTLLRALQMWEYTTVEERSGGDVPRSTEEIGKNISPLFSLPFFRSETADLETQAFYHTRFVVDLLYKERLLGPNGYTRGLANLVTHLFDMEPANFVFARLLGKGYIHTFLNREKDGVKKGDRSTHLTVKLTQLMAWFLGRRRLPETIPKNRQNRKSNMPSKLCPALPTLPKIIGKEILAFNERVNEHVQELAWTVASNKKTSEADMLLPLTAGAFPLGWDSRGDETTGPFDGKSAFGKRTNKSRAKYRTRAPIAAIDGSGDLFRSPADIVTSCRNVLHLDFNSFPTVAANMYGEDQKKLEPTNSWMLDFMMHGRMKYLWEDNGLGPGKAYKMIQGFKECVSKATTALAAYAPKDDIVVETFKALGEEIDDRLKADAKCS